VKQVLLASCSEYVRHRILTALVLAACSDVRSQRVRMSSLDVHSVSPLSSLAACDHWVLSPRTTATLSYTPCIA